jgi:hypothetical protein
VVKEKVVLRGVPTDTSEPSGLDMDSVRAFRLNEDLFFLIPAAGGLPAYFGEEGTRVLSFDIICVNAGVAGDTVNVVSAELGTGGTGDGAERPEGCDTDAGNPGTLNVESARV